MERYVCSSVTSSTWDWIKMTVSSGRIPPPANPRAIVGIRHRLSVQIDGSQGMDIDDAVDAFVVLLQGDMILNLAGSYPGAACPSDERRKTPAFLYALMKPRLRYECSSRIILPARHGWFSANTTFAHSREFNAHRLMELRKEEISVSNSLSNSAIRLTAQSV
jgi:hypothetical protein